MVKKSIQLGGILLGIAIYLGSGGVSQASCALTPNNIEICIAYGQGSGRYFPNGAIIKSNTSPKVYYLENFTKRPIESPEMLESRFDWRGLIVTSQEALDEIPNGTALTFRDGSLLSNRGAVYIISNGLRRPIVSPEAFLRLGFKWSNVKAVSDAEINLHGMGEAVTTSSNYPDGVVIKTPGGKMYLVEDDQRRYIPSPLIFESRFRWQEAVDLNFSVAPTFNPNPKGDVYYPDGLLIAGEGKVWVMENNQRVPISSPEIFESLGMSWAMVREATPFEMTIIPKNEGGQIGKNMKFYPDGTLVKADDSPQVYVFEKGNLRPINSPAIFFSYGYTFDKLLTFPRRVINQYSKRDPLPMNSGPVIPVNPTVSISVAPSSTAEDGSGNLVYTFTRSAVSSNTLTVNYTVGGTATNGTDYTGISVGGGTKTVTIGANQTTATVTVNPNTDSDVEPNETVILTLASGSGYTLGSPNTATGTIINDDVAISAVSLGVSPSSTAEDGSGNLVYTFTRSAVSSNTLTVNYTVGGTATNGTDYTGISVGGGTKTVTIGANQTTATVTINPTVDSDIESNETVIFTLASGSGYTLGSPNTATGTINNDDVQAAMLPDPTLYLPLNSDLLDDSSNAFTNVSSTSPTIISETTPIGTSAASFAGGAWLEFADHPLLNPGTEDFFVTAYVKGGGNPTGDYPGWFGKGSYQSSTGAFNAFYDRTLDRMGAGASNPWREALASPGSAIPVNTWRRMILQRVGSTVTLYQDNVAMGTYDATNLDLTNTHPFMIGRDLGADRWIYEITDFAYVKGQSLNNTQRSYLQTNSYFDGLNPSSGLPIITISISPNSVAEDGSGNLVYTFTRSVVDSSALTVNYTVGGTAINGTDYTGISAGGGTKTVTIGANQATATVTVDPSVDSDIESNETVVLTIISGTGYDIGSSSSATGAITENVVGAASLLGWELNATNVGLAPHGLNCDTLPAYTGPNPIPANSTITNTRFTSYVNLNNGNITIERSCFKPAVASQGLPIVTTTNFDIWAPPTAGPVTIRDSEFDGSLILAGPNGEFQAAFATGFWGVANLERNYIHTLGSGLALYNTGTQFDVLIEHNYVTDMLGWGDGSTSGNHSDSFTIRDFTDSMRPDRQAIIRNNRFDCNGPNCTGAFFIQPNGASIDNVLIEGNYLTGYGFTLGLEFQTLGYSNISAINNRFTPLAFGPYYVTGGPGFATFSENYIYNALNPGGRGTPVN